MSLIVFHRVLISTAILLGFFLSIWAVGNYARNQDLADLLLAFAAGVTSIVLIFYLRHLRRFLGSSLFRKDTK
ncbi:MAG: hypothetical protein HYX86_01510 [Chloroflexi bacterium]|nr:hypothetical protein [Chloroflexota bacterium]